MGCTWCCLPCGSLVVLVLPGINWKLSVRYSCWLKTRGIWGRHQNRWPCFWWFTSSATYSSGRFFWRASTYQWSYRILFMVDAVMYNSCLTLCCLAICLMTDVTKVKIDRRYELQVSNLQPFGLPWYCVSRETALSLADGFLVTVWGGEATGSEGLGVNQGLRDWRHNSVCLCIWW